MRPTHILDDNLLYSGFAYFVLSKIYFHRNICWCLTKYLGPLGFYGSWLCYSIFKFRNIRQCHITIFLSFWFWVLFLPSYLTCNGSCDYIWPAWYSRIISLFKVSLPTTLVVLATSIFLCHIIYSQILGIKNGHLGD